MYLLTNKMTKFSFVIFSIFLLNISCASRKDDEKANLSMSEITKSKTSKNTKKVYKSRKKRSPKKRTAKRSAKKTKSTALSADISKHCIKLLREVAVPYKRLLMKSEPGVVVNDNSSVFRITQTNPKNCYSKNNFKAVLKDAYGAVNNHKIKIGIILPLSGPKAQFSAFILDGFKASIAELGLSFERDVVLKDDQGIPQITEKRLAELVFRDKVTTVIGGLSDETANVLANWSSKLQIPAILLTRNRDTVIGASHAFRIYPDEQRLAKTLAVAAASKQFKKVAILRPSNKKSDQLVEYFKASLVSTGGQVVNNLIYTADNFESMEAVTRQLFGIDVTTRRAEFRRAFERQKRRAKAQGVAFNPRMVSLSPIVNFDAVLIPDDFRTVKYFTKLFKFHAVKEIGLIGNHEWRSPALLQPWDNFLQDAIFADFISSYSKVPASIAAATVGSPYFINAKDVVPVDFRLIGYRVGRVAALTLQNPKIKRRRISRSLVNYNQQDPELFGKGHLFDKDHSAVWPTHLFKVGDKKISLEVENMQIDHIEIGQRSKPQQLNSNSDGNRKKVRRDPAPMRMQAAIKRKNRVRR